MYTGLLDSTPRGERVTGAFLRSMAVYFPSLTLHKLSVIAILAICNKKIANMENFGDRLKEERKRLGLKQGELAGRVGTTNVAQSRYESGDRSPDWAYLSAVAEAGVDVLYVLTGRRNSTELTPDEEMLLTGYRALDTKGRAGVLGMISGMTQQGATAPAPAKSSKVRQNFEGANIGQHVTGDVTAPFSINMGTAGRKKKRES